MGFKEIKAEELRFNPFTAIGKEWMLITAGNAEKFNTMTASWGGVGVFWNKNVVTAYIRTTRYTKEFVDANELFTLSFFDKKYKKALNICGTLSGRDTDKVAQAGLTPLFTDGTAAFGEADMILVCKKLYHDFMPPENFADKKNEAWYPEKDYHTLYIAEIVKILVR
ncbi:MAG: flavin reductase [Clostridiales bacterium]|jgi:flavin reductase (DIM6/NTAB) family NADH-FMN oxidoreductase RutF|nr:flavin reductase [Clostridiales bacterium]